MPISTPAPTVKIPVGTATPAPVPTQAEETAIPTITAPTPTPLIERRVVELEWPRRLRFGDSDILRLSLIPSKEGYTVSAEFPEHRVESNNIPVSRPGGYDLQAVARLDGVGFEISPTGEQVRSLPLEEAVDWHWSLTPRAPGSQRLSVILLLRWIPSASVGGAVHESLAYSKSLEIGVTSFFGLTRGQTMTGGLFGLILGASLGVFSLLVFVRPVHSSLQAIQPNPDVVIEPHPNLQILPDEQKLLQVLFRRYARLAVQSEYLSGYSGARTFLALPIRADGRADAYTIVKIGEARTILREFENYEAFVKDTLPPITARIQHPPVVVQGSASSKRTIGESGRVWGDKKAALQYTFIAEPGHTPTSLRQALLENSDSSFLVKLFETFGPNWWMQRTPYTFRLAQEYDTLLPAHLVLEPAKGRGKILDGQMPPSLLDLQIGDLVTLRRFPSVERRADGQSLALRGVPTAGQPPVRVRWMSLSDPDGLCGRVTATRLQLLEGFVQGFDRYGLPDPLTRLPDLLQETVIGTRSIIHGDLNLENVLVGPGEFVWLIDFAQTREGHPLFDFAHLEAEVIAHILAPRVSPEDYLSAVRAEINLPSQPPYSLLSALHSIASRCSFNSSQQREYHLSLYLACLGALKYDKQGSKARHLLYLTAAFLGQNL